MQLLTSQKIEGECCWSACGWWWSGRYHAGSMHPGQRGLIESDAGRIDMTHYPGSTGTFVSTGPNKDLEEGEKGGLRQ